MFMQRMFNSCARFSQALADLIHAGHDVSGA